jgi:hypothetical protein
MTDLYLRKWGCGICGQLVIADLDDGTLTCDCSTVYIPQWVLIDAWQRRKWLQNFTQTTQAEIERLKLQRQSQAGA